ncbi:MAG: outer membrane protein, partial [Allosphingosinicella sp.]
EQTDLRDPETDLGTLTIDDDRQAFTGGVFVGYDRQVAPKIVLGVEGGVDVSTGDSIENASGTGLVSVDPEWSIDLTTRAGYLVNPNTLAYVRGGYANARIETNVTSGATQLTDSENRDGWLLGAGIEQQFLHNISGRLEYRYSELSEGAGSYDRHRVLAGIAYRF